MQDFMGLNVKKEGRFTPTPEFLLAQYVSGGTPPFTPDYSVAPSMMARAASTLWTTYFC